MRNTLRPIEQAKRFPQHHPRAIALSTAVLPRNKRRSWARLGNDLFSKFIPLPLPEAESRAPIILHSKPPWESMNSVTIFPELEGISSKSDNLARIRTASTNAMGIKSQNFTDGLKVEGCKQGGAQQYSKSMTTPHGKKQPWLKTLHSPAPLKRSAKR